MYKPKDIIEFGTNKGHTLESIYKFVPEYIEYLLKEHDNFSVDLEDFYEMPIPTLFYSDRRFSEIFDEKRNEFYKMGVKGFREYDSYPASVKESYLFREPYDLAEQKAKEYFKVDGLTKYPRVAFATGMIQALGFKPKKHDFKFSDEAIAANDKKKSSEFF